MTRRKGAGPPEFDQPGLFPSREQHLVLLAALGQGSAARLAYEQWLATVDLERDFDREVFRLLPLLYDNLRRLGHQDALTGRLKGTYRLAWAGNHRLFEETRPVLDRFLAAGLRVMVLKGAPLALTYYGNPAVRPMADVDFAVPSGQVEAAAAILADLGYVPWLDLDADARRFRHAVGFRAPGRKELDLHWHILLDFCDDGADEVFWQTAQPFRFLDHEILAPDATRMLLLTIIHGLRWNEEPPVRWIPDAVMILRSAHAQLDWDWVVAFATGRSITYRLRLGLAYLAETFSAEVPPVVLSRLSEVRPTWRERLELRTLMKPVRYESAVGPLLYALSEFPRLPGTGTPLRAVGAFTHFLRFHWGLSGRREIPGRLLQGIRRRSGRAVARAAHVRG